MSGSGTGRRDPTLPAAVQSRLVALAVRGLSSMAPTQIPAALRKVAAFAPAKRARLIGAPLVAAIASDDAFRDHLATQVRALEPELTGSLDDGSAAGFAGERRLDAAAAAVILRPAGWEELLSEVRDEDAERSAEGDAAAATIARLESSLDQLKGELKSVREKNRAQVDQLKADNAQLRRTLGQTRVELKEGTEAAVEARAEAEVAARRAAAAARSLEAENRRLRGRVAELEGDHVAARRAVRDDRQSEVIRLRLLLDTLTDAASGLRRELALPPSDSLPADSVVALEPATDSAAVGAGRSMPDDDPALLRRLIEIPRVHLIIDGYNVSKGAWPTLPLDQQRARLVGGVSAVVAGKAMETTVVFDGADLANPPPVPSARSVRVRFSPPGVIADDLIRQLVEAEPVGRPIVVVSSDREVARTVTKKGARALAADALARALGV